jgi:hypothetical protein
VKWRCLTALTTLVASGCNAGPDYHVPADTAANAPEATGAFLNGDSPAFAVAPLPDHWWRLYDDERLDGYVGEALAANTDLRAADANLKRANAAIREAEAAQTGIIRRVSPCPIRSISPAASAARSRRQRPMPRPLRRRETRCA